MGLVKRKSPQKCIESASKPLAGCRSVDGWCGGVERARLEWSQQADERSPVKGQQKPKQLAKKAPQKTLKEKRHEKNAKKKAGRTFDH